MRKTKGWVRARNDSHNIFVKILIYVKSIVWKYIIEQN